MNFLRRDNSYVVDGKGKKVQLRGVNVGGWLMMEAYFVYARALPVQLFEKEFEKQCGKPALIELMKKFRDNFITEDDFKQIASWGMNCIRLPFHYKIAQNSEDIAYIDRALAWARKYKVYLILDLHAAFGAQNPDWHSDSLDCKAQLWTKPGNRHKTYALWERLADRYKNEEMVAGYDVLNEPVMDNNPLLNEFYRECIKAIRRSDKNHMLFIEGQRWAQYIDMLDDFADDNWIYSIHYYEPMEFTFNLIQFMHYPWPEFNKDKMRKRMEGYWHLAQKMKRPVHVGEFGVNYRQGTHNEHIYLRDELKIFNDLGFHWNYWTYKCVKNHMFPDGIYGYYPNTPWVHRQGPKTGWDCWGDEWPTQSREMVNSWKTKAFTLNTHIIKELKKGCLSPK